MSSDTLFFEGKSNSKWWLTFLPTPNPSIVYALEGSQHCHLAAWSIEGTDLSLSPLTQHDMQKITWAMADLLTDQTRMSKVNLQRSRNLVILEELWRIYDYTGTNALRSSPSLCSRSDIWRARMCIPCRKLERTTCLATWAAHAPVKFGHEEQSTNKNKQTVPNEESENIEGLPSTLLFIWPFVKILCISSESSKSRSIFEYICCLSNLTCTASDSTSPSDLPPEAVVQISGSGRSWKTIARHALQELV